MKIKFTLSIGFAGAEHEDIIEYNDNTPDAEIEADWQEWSRGYIDGGWTRLEDGNE